MPRKGALLRRAGDRDARFKFVRTFSPDEPTPGNETWQVCSIDADVDIYTGSQYWTGVDPAAYTVVEDGPVVEEEVVGKGLTQVDIVRYRLAGETIDRVESHWGRQGESLVIYLENGDKLSIFNFQYEGLDTNDGKG